MTYKEYIQLGFKRTDMRDSVVFDQTGYHGYYLEKKISKKMSIFVYHDELDKPRLYIKKKDVDQWHIILIGEEIVRDLW